MSDAVRCSAVSVPQTSPQSELIGRTEMGTNAPMQSICPSRHTTQREHPGRGTHDDTYSATFDANWTLIGSYEQPSGGNHDKPQARSTRTVRPSLLVVRSRVGSFLYTSVTLNQSSFHDFRRIPRSTPTHRSLDPGKNNQIADRKALTSHVSKSALERRRNVKGGAFPMQSDIRYLPEAPLSDLRL